MHYIIQLDQQLFLWIQHHCHNSILDTVMPWFRNKYSWFPLYAFIIGTLVYYYRKTGLLIILVALVCVLLSDTFSSHIIKPAVQRIRPCEDPVIGAQFTPVINCGHRGFSFTSSHAANHFSLAFGLVLFFYKRKKWLLALAILWAGLISLAQVYVGVHYPLDITAGAILGMGIATSVHKVLQRYFNRYFQSVN